MADKFSFTFDSASLKLIQRMAGFEAFLEPNLEAAMKFIIAGVQDDARAYMWATFQNPTGPLEDSVETDVPDPWTGRVYSESPYAWRREEGFSGMTDSLGRFYAHDPGIHFFARTLRKDKPWIREMLRDAVIDALVAMGGP